MKRFKKREAPLSRRSSRLWMLRLRRFGIVLCAVGLTAAGGYYVWKNGVIEKTANWASAKTLSVTASAGFKVNDIFVTGRERIPAADLIAHLDIRQNAPIFSVDIAQAQQSLSEIPWIQSVSVTRRLPGTIYIDIKERAPAALWQYQKKLSVIDRTGRVLTSKDLQNYKDLPLVVGESAPESVAEILQYLHAEPEIAKTIESATRVGGRRWDLKLKNGLTVKLPERETEFALRKLVSQQKKHGIFEKNIATIDLRVPDQMVVEPADKQNKTNI